MHNLKYFFRPFGMAGGFDLNLAFSIVGTILSGHLSRLYIPWNEVKASSSPGQHSVFQPSDGTQRICFDRDGADRDRMNKIDAISEDKTLLDVIRVCWENPARSYNCGRCSTCTRTLSAYQSLATLDKSPMTSPTG